MRRGALKVTIPNDHGAPISGPTVDQVLEQAGISLEDFDQA
jgi:hypothetical protein